MNQDIKTTFGYLILLAAVVGFVLSFIAINYFLSIIFIVGGILTWLIYINVAKITIHRPTGAILIIFGILLASAIFMAFGIEQDMWGGYHIKQEGAIFALIILFFSIMPGLVFYYFSRSRFNASVLPPSHTQAAPTATPPTEEQYYQSPEDWEDYNYYYDPEMTDYYDEEDYEDEDDLEDEEEE